MSALAIMPFIALRGGHWSEVRYRGKVQAPAPLVDSALGRLRISV
jgi:hypothetical protein